MAYFLVAALTLKLVRLTARFTSIDGFCLNCHRFYRSLGFADDLCVECDDEIWGDSEAPTANAFGGTA